MATVNGTCSYGQTVTGYGGTIKISITDGSVTSNTVSVTTVTGVTSYSDGNTTGNIPISSNVAYKFTFSTPVTVAANSTAYFTANISSTN
jgi:hypothetical protein